MNFSAKRKVKIVCTLGPASRSVERICALIDAGMDVARLNFSHGTHEYHLSLIKAVREASQIKNRPIAIMQDLQGPKMRVGVLPKEGIQLNPGDVVLLYPEGSTPKSSTQGKILIPISAEIAPSVSADARAGGKILFNDGRIIATVSHTAPPELIVEIETGGHLTSQKGINLPGTPLSIPCLMEKDLQDLAFGLSQGVDAVALSFVRSIHDIENLKEHMRRLSNEPPIVIPKIEREEALENQDAIIEVSDGLLIARGDMAVEIGAERVPIIQKRLIYGCNQIGVPVITATQMLESMIFSPTPTRAEASDVANAVFDGTDAVMLSAETASGEFPVETVRTMTRIVLEAERTRELYSRHPEILPIPGSEVDAIANSAAQIAEHVGAVAIACITHTGMAARTLAKYRPSTPIVAIMDNEAMVRRLSFTWGVQGEIIPKIVPTDDLFTVVENVLKSNEWAEHNDLIVVTAGVPSLRRGTTNMVKVHRLGGQRDRIFR